MGLSKSGTQSVHSKFQFGNRSQRKFTKIFLLLILVLSLANCSKDIFMGMKDVEKREKLNAKMISESSLRGQISLERKDGLGTYTKANTYIESREETLRIPARAIMSVFDDFPFKKTLIQILSMIPETNK